MWPGSGNKSSGSSKAGPKTRSKNKSGAGKAPVDPGRGERRLDYAQILAAGRTDHVNPIELAAAWRLLEQDMALVPGGDVSVVSLEPPPLDAPFTPPARHLHRVRVDSLYVDRFTVTHREFARFVASGGYENPELWPPEVLPMVLQFVDSTGKPGPAGWKNGQPPAALHDHPVVGVSWFEARAFALWMGKRLPTSAEWQRAGTWFAPQHEGSAENRYPWGNAFEPERANTWFSEQRATVPVHDFYEGATPNGIYQLVGNVWEWVGTPFDGGGHAPGTQFLLEQGMAEIRGGAFDTYFASQVTCQFRSGQALTYRGHNVGFRCCLSQSDVCAPPDPSAFLAESQRA
jgi:gamma-glutamyl hercynylcysteine S-oxide synthase